MIDHTTEIDWPRCFCQRAGCCCLCLRPALHPGGHECRGCGVEWTDDEYTRSR